MARRYFESVIVVEMSEFAQSYAEDGAIYLDKVNPQWFNKINLETLDLSEGTFSKDVGGRKGCVLCQVFEADFGTATGLAGIDVARHDPNEPRSSNLGFDVHDVYVEYVEEKADDDIWEVIGKSADSYDYAEARHDLAYQGLTEAWLKEINDRLGH